MVPTCPTGLLVACVWCDVLCTRNSSSGSFLRSTFVGSLIRWCHATHGRDPIVRSDLLLESNPASTTARILLAVTNLIGSKQDILTYTLFLTTRFSTAVGAIGYQALGLRDVTGWEQCVVWCCLPGSFLDSALQPPFAVPGSHNIKYWKFGNTTQNRERTRFLRFDSSSRTTYSGIRVPSIIRTTAAYGSSMNLLACCRLLRNVSRFSLIFASCFDKYRVPGMGDPRTRVSPERLASTGCIILLLKYYSTSNTTTTIHTITGDHIK